MLQFVAMGEGDVDENINNMFIFELEGGEKCFVDMGEGRFLETT